jgi:hypothetical protein
MEYWGSKRNGFSRRTWRKLVKNGEAFQFREPEISYPDVFDTKNVDIGAENSYFWNTNSDISI